MERLRKLIQEILAESLFDWKEEYPNLEIDGDKVTLYHFGPVGIKSLDPKKAFNNTHDYTPDFNFWSQPRVFFYTNLKDKEPRVNGELYTIQYSLDRLYPVNSDPLNLKEKYCKGKDGAVATYCYLNAIKKNYDGYISRWDGNKLRADIWVSVPIPQDQQQENHIEYKYVEELNIYVNDKAFSQYEKWKYNLDSTFPNDTELSYLKKLANSWSKKNWIRNS